MNLYGIINLHQPIKSYHPDRLASGTVDWLKGRRLARVEYQRRLIEEGLRQSLKAAGAVLIRGPKACGKTLTAKQYAHSVLQVDIDPKVKTLMEFDPVALLKGEAPLLLDEWQTQPLLWDVVRHSVDGRGEPGQFILTGSANPEEAARMHSGAGRIIVIDMRTMSWQEMGYSTGAVSLASLLEGSPLATSVDETALEVIIERILIGGWPGNLGKDSASAQLLNRSYMDLLAEVDISRVSHVSRDPVKVKALLRSLARNVATTTDIQTLTDDVRQDTDTFSRVTATDYLQALERLMAIENQPVWNTHLRSSAQLRKAPKRHFADPSMAATMLGCTQEALLHDPNYLGLLFESLVVHDLRIYAQVNDAEVFHFRDSYNREIDAIVQDRAGRWAAFEVKLRNSTVEKAASNLLKVTADVNRKPASLNVIVGTGLSYTRPDGVNVISLGALGC
jgi:predicted AAA+ superfamily ATPase